MALKHTSELKPMLPGVFKTPTKDKQLPELLGRYCHLCDTIYFFPRNFCPNCLGALEQVGLGSKGTVYSFTIVRTKPPLGLPQPYGVAYITMEKNGTQVFCLLDPTCLGKIHIGVKVRLKVGQMGLNTKGQACLRPYFTIDQKDNHRRK